MKANKKGCVSACYTDESTYPFIGGVKKCASNCYTDDYEGGKTKMSTANICIT